MSLRSDIERKVKLKEFHRTVEQLLTPEDKDYLFYAMREYNTYKSVAKLMLALNSCLDTAEKLDLLPYIRDLIPKHDQRKFDSLAPYNRMAHPVQLTKTPQPSSQKKLNRTTLSAPPRILTLAREKGAPLGFSIRGGREHDLGIYISHIDSLSLAERSGLQIGDRILMVNGISFESITHGSAVLVLKSHDELKIGVKSVGRIPGQKLSRNSFIWVDQSGSPIKNGEAEATGAPLERVEETAGDRLLASRNKHKVVLHSDKRTSLGFSIRGGSEYGLGIYISVVDKGSPSHEGGLQVGDQIMDVNGHGFVSIFHQEAVHILRSYPTLIMTIKSLGKLPTLPVKVRKQSFEPSDGKQDEKSTSPAVSPSKTQHKASNFFNSLPSPSKRTTSLSTLREEPSPPHSLHQSELSLNQRTPQSSELQRAHSVKLPPAGRSNPISYEPKQRGFDATDSTGNMQERNRSQSGSTSLLHARGKRHAVSPLATHESRATPPNSPPTATYSFPTSPEGVRTQTAATGVRFFERGVGTQVMLASATSQAKQLLFDRARRQLEMEECQALDRTLKEYEDGGKSVADFAGLLVSILNTPEKLQLLNEVRSVLHPADLSAFDEAMTPHELAAFHRKSSGQHEQDLRPDSKVENQYNLVLTDIQNTNGREVLRKTSANGRTQQPVIDLGAFANSAAQSLLHKASTSSGDQDLAGLQTRESFLNWYSTSDDHPGPSATHQPGKSATPSATHQPGQSATPSATHQPGQSAAPSITRERAETTPHTHNTPVTIEIQKNSPFLGLAIEGGVDTLSQDVRIREVREGGAAFKDGFLKPGFEILEVDGIRVKGKTNDEAIYTVAKAYAGISDSMKFIVIPS